MPNTLPFTRQTYFSHLELWQRCLQQREICCVFNVPISGRLNRILNLTEYVSKNKMSVLVVNLDIEQIEYPSDCDRFFEPGRAIVITPAEKLLQPDYSEVFHHMLWLQRKHQVGIIFFFDAFWHQIEHLDNQLKGALTQNVDFFPLLSKDDAIRFISYLEAKWKVSISKAQKISICIEGSGHTWLIKEAVRQVSKGVPLEEVFKSQVYQFKLMSIWQALDDTTKNALKVLKNSSLEVNGPAMSESLQQLGFVNASNKNRLPQCIVHAIESERVPVLSLKNDKVLCGITDITAIFTKSEQRLLNAFILNSNKVISRDDLANYYWQELVSEKYSDWALDQAVKRLRAKLSKLGKTSEKIVTVKGKGYALEAERT